MFNRFYSTVMRNGSRLLFAIAVLLFFAGLVQGLETFDTSTDLHPFRSDNQLQWGWLELGRVLVTGLSFTIWPLFGSLLINRVDHWLGIKDTPRDMSELAERS